MFSAKLVVKKWSGFFKYIIVYIVINRTFSIKPLCWNYYYAVIFRFFSFYPITVRCCSQGPPIFMTFILLKTKSKSILA